MNYTGKYGFLAVIYRTVNYEQYGLRTQQLEFVARVVSDDD